MYSLAQETFHQNLIQYYLDRLMTPGGVVLVVVGLLLASLIVGIEKWKWFAFTLAVYLGCFSYLRATGVGDKPVLPQPFLLLSSLSQPLTVGCLLLVLIAACRPVPWQRHKWVSSIAIWILVVQVVVAGRQAAGGFTERGLTAIASYVAVFLILSVGMSRWLYDMSHVRQLARAVSGFALLLCLSSLYVMVINPDAAFFGRRFVGVVDGPNRIGAMLAVAIPYSLMLAWDQGSTRASRTLHILIASVSVLLLMLSGSRAGALTMIVGVTVFFRKRLGAYALGVVVCTCLALAIAVLIEVDVGDAGATMLRTNDSRSEYWLNTLRFFAASPLVGVAMEHTAVESSFISVAAQAGIIGLIPLLIMLGSMFRSSTRLLSFHHAGEYRPAIDLVLAGYAQFLVIWVFEGLLLGLVTGMVFIVHATLAIGTVVTERLSTDLPANEEHPLDESEWQAASADRAVA